MNTFLSILLVSSLLCFTRAGELKVQQSPKFLSLASQNDQPLSITNVVNTLLILLGVSPETTSQSVEPWLFTSNALIAPKSTWILHVEGLNHLTKTGYSIVDGEEFNIGLIQSRLSLSNTNKVVAVGTVYVTSESDWNNLDETLKTQTSTIDKDAAVKYIVIICDACSSEDAGDKMGKQIEKTFEKIAKDDPDAFTLALATKETARIRRARSTQAEVANITIATMYSDEYPTMFNLFFWTSLVLALIVISIVYVFLTLDPGSDTIIYRMTTPRLKVD